jgi:hypothetical protein
VVVSGSMPGRFGRTVALLRGDREEGGRADPLQDRHQRSAPRLT